MSIGELAKLSGIPASTIRYWERIGVLPRAPRVSGRRRYQSDAVHRLTVLRFARECGFDLAQMRELFFGFREGAPPTERWLELGRRKRAEIDARIAQLTAMRGLVDRVLRCRCVDLEECGRRIAAAG